MKVTRIGIGKATRYNVMGLTPAEAGILREIVNHVGGDPNGPRGFMDELGVDIDDATPRGLVPLGDFKFVDRREPHNLYLVNRWPMVRVPKKGVTRK